MTHFCCCKYSFWCVLPIKLVGVAQIIIACFWIIHVYCHVSLHTLNGPYRPNCEEDKKHARHHKDLTLIRNMTWARTTIEKIGIISYRIVILPFIKCFRLISVLCSYVLVVLLMLGLTRRDRLNNRKHNREK